MLIFNSWALSLSPRDDEMSVLQPVRFYTRYPLQLLPELNFPGNLPISVFWEAFVFLVFVCCQQPQTGQALQPGRSLLFPVCWNSFGSISREINCCLFITTFQFWRLNWCCIGMGAEYNMRLEIPKYWSWLNPSQCREELISLSGLIIYFILTHKKCLPNVLLHLGTAQKSLSPYKRFNFSCLVFICLFVLLGTRHGSKQLPETLKKIQGWVDLGQFCVLAINQSFCRFIFPVTFVW